MRQTVTMILLLTALLLAYALPLHAMAQNGCGGSCNTCHSVSIEEANALLKDVGAVKEIKAAPINGLWEVTIEREGRQGVAYMDFGKKHLLAGPIYAIATIAAQSAPPPPKKTKVDIAIPLEHSLVMGNPKGSKRLIVFTDPECPFCDKLHGELKKLIALEPELVVYIKLYPLKMHPKAHDKARVILAQNSLAMLEKSFAKEKLPEATDKQPAKPVDDTIALAGSLGIDATPTIIFPDGQMVEGWRDAETLGKMLNMNK
jgi:thiol:disulfide interchange protein DsbC